jgi:hypothetical protein
MGDSSKPFFPQAENTISASIGSNIIVRFMAQFIDDSSPCQVGKILYFSHTASYPLLDLTNHAPLDITAGFGILYAR